MCGSACVVCCLLVIVCCVLSVVGRSLFVVCCFLGGCVLVVDWCALCVDDAGCLPVAGAVCCWLLLFVVCCMVIATCSLHAVVVY